MTNPINKLPKGRAAARNLYRKYKYNAKIRKRVFSISFNKFLVITSSNCIYCGCLPNQTTKPESNKRQFNGEYIYNGIDRWFQNQGYTTKNSVACCRDCNMMKGRLESGKIFLSKCSVIVRNQIQKVGGTTNAATPSISEKLELS